jgi:hypothetical protein
MTPVAKFFGVHRTHGPRLWRNSSRRQIQPGVQTMNEPYRGIAGSQNADGTVAERVILARADDV